MATLTIQLHARSAQEQLDQALIALRLAKHQAIDAQVQHRTDLGLFMDSRIEDALKEIDDAIEHLTCSFCPHACVELKALGGLPTPLCSLCAGDYGPCFDCKQETKIAEMCAWDGQLRCVECEASRVELEHGYETAR